LPKALLVFVRKGIRNLMVTDSAKAFEQSRRVSFER